MVNIYIYKETEDNLKTSIFVAKLYSFKNVWNVKVYPNSCKFIFQKNQQ